MLKPLAERIRWLPKLRAPARAVVILGVAVLVVLIATGCAATRQDPKAVAAGHAEDFNSGTTGAKNIWDLVVAAVNADDDAGALAALKQLRDENELTPGQMQAVQQTESAIRGQTKHPAQKTGTPNP